MTAWEDYLAAEREYISSLLRPPPTRADTIKAGWEAVRDRFQDEAIDGRLLVVHDLGVIAPVLFETITYGEQQVIEAEGVVVQRL